MGVAVLSADELVVDADAAQAAGARHGFLAPGLGLGCLLSYVLCFIRRFDAGLAGVGFQQLTDLMYGALFALALAGVVTALSRRSPSSAAPTSAPDGGEALKLGGRVSRGRATGSAPVTFAQVVPGGVQFAPQADPSLPVAILGTLLGLCVTALLAVASLIDIPAGVFFCSGLALGAGLFLLSREWFCLSVRLQALALLRSMSVAIVVAGVTQAVFKLVSLPGVAAVLLAVLCVGSLAAFAVCVRSGCAKVSPGDAQTASAQVVHGGEARPSADGTSLLAVVCDIPQSLSGAGVRPTLPQVAGLLWIPLAGMAFCSFITGLTWDPVLADETSWRSAAAEVPGVFVGALASGLIVAFAGCKHGVTGRLGVLARAVQPVAISLVLVIPVIKQLVSGPLVAIFSTTFSALGFALLTGAAFVQFCVAVAETGLDARRFASVVLATCALAAFVGLASIEVLGTAGRILCFVLEAVYFTAVAVSYALRALPPARTAAEPSQASGHDAPAAFDEGAFEARCHALAAQCGLSPRELDVLLYAGRGYGSSYIAPALGISENTVRTHVRHIYEKLGVSSREALIALVDSRPA